MIKHWKKTIFLLLGILFIASFLRIYNLGQTPPGLYADEAMYGNNAVEALETGNFKVFYEENNGREGLFINIQAIFIGFTRFVCDGLNQIISSIIPIDSINPINPIALLRLPSAIFGILTVLGVYLLTKELFQENSKQFKVSSTDELNFAQKSEKNLEFKISHSESIALLSSFLLATSFWHLNFSRIGFRAIMAPFFLTWGLYLLLLSFRKTKNEQFLTTEKIQKFGFWILPILAGLVYGLGFHSYIAYRATPLLIIPILWFFWRKAKQNEIEKKFWLTTVLFSITALLTILPLGIYFFENPQDFFGRTAQISIFDSSTPLKDLGINILKTLGMFNFVGDHNWRHNIAGNPLLFWPVGILFLIGLSVTTAKASKTSPERFPAMIILTWIIVAALPVVISNEGMPHALRAILMTPPIFILASLGGVWLYEKIKPIKTIKLIKLLGFIGLIGLFVINAYVSYFIIWAQQPAVADAFHQQYVKIGQTLNAIPKEIPKYVVIDTGGHDVRKIGTPAQPIMFITDTFLPSKQKEKNLYYISPQEVNLIPAESFVIAIN